MVEHPNVFISYSQDDDEHKNWVLKLATDLRANGVDVVLDQWDLRIGQNLGYFMEQGLSSARLVLCVCSENYVSKVDNRKCGSGYEGTLINQSLIRNQNLDYIIPVIRKNETDKKTPLMLGGKLYVDFRNDSAYTSKFSELLERIYDVDIVKKPPLGNNPFSTSLSLRIDAKTKIESVQYSNPAMTGSVAFQYDNNNGNYCIGIGDFSFTTHWSRSGNDSIHIYGKIGYKRGTSKFPLYGEIENFDFSSNCRTVKKGEIVIIENSFGHFAAIKVGSIKSSGHGFDADEMEFEYQIYEV